MRLSLYGIGVREFLTLERLLRENGRIYPGWACWWRKGPNDEERDTCWRENSWQSPSLFPIFLNNREHPGTAVKSCPKHQPISRLCYS